MLVVFPTIHTTNFTAAKMSEGCNNKTIISLRGKWSTREVWLNNKPLSPTLSQSVRNHSPDGFNWGYAGSGPAQLALAILLEFVSEAEALKHYQSFKWRVIAHLPQRDFDVKINLSTSTIIP